MSKMIQIRNVPDKIHLELRHRALSAGMSLSDYLLKELERTLQRPTPQQMRERLSSRAQVSLLESPADAVRAERDAR